MLRRSLAITALLLTACTDPAGEDDTGTADDTGGPTIDVPTDAAGLATWLADESYAGWSAESAVHDATGNSPHGRVRTYFNDVLEASFGAGNESHTVGSASVKELYDAMDTRVGWAVMVKIAEGDAADTWYWYIDNGGATMDGNGLGGCNGCHSAGTDRVVTAYPLQ
ncbi:MAG: hypothetical protein KDK70_06760 [Myxococcales bacterium]|nr:hypothetical protein [Myxococcales bacterium]